MSYDKIVRKFFLLFFGLLLFFSFSPKAFADTQKCTVQQTPTNLSDDMNHAQLTIKGPAIVAGNTYQVKVTGDPYSPDRVWIGSQSNILSSYSPAQITGQDGSLTTPSFDGKLDTDSSGDYFQAGTYTASVYSIEDPSTPVCSGTFPIIYEPNKGASLCRITIVSPPSNLADTDHPIAINADFTGYSGDATAFFVNEKTWWQPESAHEVYLPNVSMLTKQAAPNGVTLGKPPVSGTYAVVVIEGHNPDIMALIDHDNQCRKIINITQPNQNPDQHQECDLNILNTTPPGPSDAILIKAINFSGNALTFLKHNVIVYQGDPKTPVQASFCVDNSDLAKDAGFGAAYNLPIGSYTVAVTENCTSNTPPTPLTNACSADFNVCDPTDASCIANTGGGPTSNNDFCLSKGDNTFVCDTAIGPITTSPEEIIKAIMGVILSIAGGIALLLIIISGYRMIVSQGNPENIKNARDQLTAAIVGLLFVIFSLVILQVIGYNILGLPGFAK